MDTRLAVRAFAIIGSILCGQPLLALEAGLLLRACESQNDRSLGFCMGYIGGIYEGVILHDDYANAVRSAQGDEKEVRTWCAPSNISYEDMAAYLVEFLNHNPRYVTNRIHAEVTVYAFFSDKFSCSTS